MAFIFIELINDPPTPLQNSLDALSLKSQLTLEIEIAEDLLISLKIRALDLVQKAMTSPVPGTTLNLLKFPVTRPEPQFICDR